jgi:hypothetical protein
MQGWNMDEKLYGEIGNLINKAVEDKLKENNAMLLEKMEKDKNDIQSGLEQMMSIISALVKKN